MTTDSNNGTDSNEKKCNWQQLTVTIILVLTSIALLSLITITDIQLIKNNHRAETYSHYAQPSPADSTRQDNQNLQSKLSSLSTPEGKNYQEQQKKLDSIVSDLTLAVNSVNNVLAGGAIAISILTLFIGLVGLFGYKSLKDDIRRTVDLSLNMGGEFKQDINDDQVKFKQNINKDQIKFKEGINEDQKKFKQDLTNKATSLYTSFDGLQDSNNTKISLFEKQNEEMRCDVNHMTTSFIKQEEYIHRTIEYLYQATEMLLNQHNNIDISNRILQSLFHNLQIAKLYRFSIQENKSIVNHNKRTAFEYLINNGSEDDIPHLLYVIKQDPNENNILMAHNVIAIIKQKCS